MSIDRAQLETLVTVVREGGFDKAAKVLHVTPSAISQRIKQLEEQVGGIVVVRANPCRATTLGAALYRHGLQVELLEQELQKSVGTGGGEKLPRPVAIGIAVNADSLATWISPAFSRFSLQTGVPVEVFVDDQDHTNDWLRSGRVLGAVTSESKAVQGCRVLALGVMRYRATASAAFVKRSFPKGFSTDAAASAPIVAYDRKDTLHAQFLRRCGHRSNPPATQLLPSPTAIVQACLAGVAWGVNPEPLVASHLSRGRLRDLVAGQFLEVPLYWQQWSIRSETVESLAAILKDEARSMLGRS
ncbi:MAG: LysR family transcriptional regulator ArgP [Deltaproteobacteria bacterium]|nr:LysR family transcriptional regulator ArgP [Deltaproteobacteria bacterium]